MGDADLISIVLYCIVYTRVLKSDNCRFGLCGKLQHVMRMEKERDLYFLSKLQKQGTPYIHLFFFFLYINHTKYKAKVRQLGLFINKFRWRGLFWGEDTVQILGRKADCLFMFFHWKWGGVLTTTRFGHSLFISSKCRLYPYNCIYM